MRAAAEFTHGLIKVESRRGNVAYRSSRKGGWGLNLTGDDRRGHEEDED